MTQVWLVPDNLESRAALETLLRKHGYEVEIVSTGAEAITTGTAEQWRLEQKMQARARQQASVAELGQRALTDADLESLMEETVRQVSLRLQVDLCNFLEQSAFGEAVLLRSGVGWMEGKVGKAMVEASPDSLARFTLGLGEPVVIEDMLTETRFTIPNLLAEHNAISGASVLVGSKEKPFGILGAFSLTKRVFTTDEIHFLQAVANILAAAIELRTSEEKYRRLFDLDSDALLLIDREDYRILEANRAAVALYGYERSELLRMRNIELSAEPEQTRQSIQQAESNIPLRMHQKKNGSVFPVEVAASNFGWHGQNVQLAAIRDITARLQMEKEILEAHDFYLQVLRDAPALIWRSNAQGACDWFNTTYLRFTGHTLEEEITLGWKDSVHPDDLESLINCYLHVYEHGIPFENEYRLRYHSGAYRWILEVGQPLISLQGQFLGFLGYCYDITDRKTAEEDLHRRTEELNLLYEAGRQLTSTLDLKLIYQTFYQFVSQTMDCSGLFVSSYDPTSRLIRCVFAVHDGGTLEVDEFPPIPLEDEGRGTQSLVIRSGEPLIIADYRSQVKTAQTTYYVDKNGITESEIVEDTDLTRSALIVPLKLEGNVMGVIQVFSYRKNAFTEENSRFLEGLALQTVAAMQNALLYQRAQAEIADRKRTEEALRVLSNASILFAEPQTSLPEMLQKLVEMIPSGLQDSGQACVRLVLEQQIYQTTNYYVSSTLLTCPVYINGHMAGKLEIGYPPASNGGPVRLFLEEEEKLLKTLARQLGNALERRRADETLRENEYKFRAIFNHHYQITGLLNLQGRILAINPAAQKFAGVGEYDMIGKLFWQAPWWGNDPELQEQVHRDLLRAARGEFIQYETINIDVNGKSHNIDFTINPILDEKGKVIYLVPEGRDITQRKLADEQLKASLAEKEVLLREIHHRVKNNLEVIISLADLQARTITDPKVLQSIRELQERVRTIALVHEDLYRSKDLANIRVQAYLLKLTDNLFQVFGSAGIDLQVQGSDLTLSIDSAIPCGLIVTELVTNAIKHAFPGELEQSDANAAARPRQIRVGLFERDGQYMLEVCDNGVGLPLDIDWQTTRSLGLRLVNRLAGQLHGILEVDVQNGTRFRMIFPKPD